MAGKKKNKRKPKNKNVSAAADDQKRSALFQIPQEVRNKIYRHLFSDTRISLGERAVSRIGCLRIVPAPNALSLLSTCRRSRDEIGRTWLHQVLFSFEDVQTMMDKLTALPNGTLSQIRHLRIRGETLMLSYDDDDVHYRLVHALKLLPGLQLDSLTVLNLYGGAVSYDVLNTLIKYGQGWKELRYISHSSQLLGYTQELDMFYDKQFDEQYQRKPQPANWASIMNSRDGLASRPSVTVYRSTLAGKTCSVINRKTRLHFEQELPSPGDEALFGTREDPFLMSPDEKSKELMVVVRRGQGVDYQEKRQSPCLPMIGDIRQDCPGMTWAEIKKKHIDVYDDDDEFSDEEFTDYFPKRGDPKKVDVYRHAEEYEWTPLNFNPHA